MWINRPDLLTSPGFVISLSLLLTNDFLLKPVLANPLTGKLSDFAGLFAFTLFWIAVFPRFRRLICLGVALSFIFWKTSYSQPFIDRWNALGVVRFSRTVDLTDLIALSILPLAYGYASRKVSVTIAPKWLPASLALLAVFAFTATSYRTKYEDYGNKYYFAGSKSELFDKIDYLRLDYFDFPLDKIEKESGQLDLQIPSSRCFNYFAANLEVTEVEGQTVVAIKKLEHRCPQKEGDRETLLADFEKEFIERLKNGTPQTTHYKSKVETPGFSPPPVRVPSPLRASPERARGKS
jgi:hypothetical protein